MRAGQTVLHVTFRDSQLTPPPPPGITGGGGTTKMNPPVPGPVVPVPPGPSAPPISVPGGTVISTTQVTAGTRVVVVADVQVPGAAGNTRRIYATVLDKATSTPVRSNILLSDTADFGDRTLPIAGVTSTGQVVVAWKFSGLGGNNNRIECRMVNPSSAAATTPVRSASAAGSASHALVPYAIAPLANGGFSVVWLDNTMRQTRAADFTPNGIVSKPEYLATGYAQLYMVT